MTCTAPLGPTHQGRRCPLAPRAILPGCDEPPDKSLFADPGTSASPIIRLMRRDAVFRYCRTCANARPLKAFQEKRRMSVPCAGCADDRLTGAMSESPTPRDLSEVQRQAIVELLRVFPVI